MGIILLVLCLGANNKKVKSTAKKRYIPCNSKKGRGDIPPQFWYTFKEGKYYKASKILEDFLKKHPHHFEAKLRLGEVYCLSEQLEKATEVAKSLYAQDPQDYDVLTLLGDIHYKQDDLEKAAFYYEAALPKDIDYQARLSLANVYFDENKFSKVYDILDPVRDKLKKNRRALELLGEAYIEGGRLKEAQKILRQALKINPYRVDTWILLAEAYMDAKEFDKSMKCLERAKHLDPNCEDVYLDIGEIYYWRGNYRKAESLIKKAISLNPSYFSPYNELGNLYFLEKKYDLAEKYHKIALKYYPEYVDAYKGLGKVYFARGEFEKAEKYFKKALSLKPEYQGETYLFLADVYKAEKRLQKYEEAILKAIQTDPHYPKPYQILIKHYKEKGLSQKALQLENKMKENCSPEKRTYKTGQ